jgi:hypothetical protein
VKYLKNIKETKISKIEVPVIGERKQAKDAEGLRKVPRMAGKYRTELK